ncbi:MAG: hypothetical protein C0171_04255 [Caldisphaera sp.]|uniref:hypothetical protein n=1 Tax=Caldisphaera sp. TaxID=2060322 RepID=UPI000CC0E0D3|nr:MAG: hypothetical protein C0201_03530 [Caldisphaera sp.]PMP90772.1 MAG: hypothetical protein C0171_04255 [Caldisphaera sp.]
MKCFSELIKYIDNQQWRLNCSSFDSDCISNGDLIYIKEEGCNEILFAPLLYKRDSLILAEENIEFINNLIYNKVKSFNSDCKTDIGKIVNIKPITYGNRSVIYEIFNEYNNKYLLKVMKRLEIDNIEDKVIKYLTNAGYRNIPRYYCSIRYKDYYYGLITEIIEGEPAATYYINSAVRFIKKLGNYESIGNNIGISLANLHNILKECREDFCYTEVVSEKVLESWMNRIQYREKWIKNNLDNLQYQEDRNMAIEALDSIDEMLNIIRPNLKNLIGKNLMRIHGDLHLYQILVSDKNIYFTDFEGEPYKFPGNKLEKEMPERDLAALIRSIDYTAIMALQLIYGSSVKDSLDLLNNDILEWEYNSSTQILNEYIKTISEPIRENMDQLDISLSFWLLERATYETVYEIIAKTGYHTIPMNALIRMKEGKDKFFKT